MYSVAQQGALVFLVVLAMELVRQLAQMVAREGPASWMVLWTAIASTLAWPLVYIALRRIRRQFEVS
jgi:cell shape-determining protein MreD